jgi:iron complex transport system ATP-binding protein
MSNAQPARLLLRNVSVSRNGRRVIDGVSAELRGGEFVALLGRNGAGKTTLLKAMAGLLPSNGDLELDGRSLASLAVHERARTIAYLPQSGEIHWPLSVVDIVALGRMPYGASRKLNADDRAAIARAIGACDLESLAPRRATELSGGERARALLARMLAVEAHILLADEPVAALDPAHQLAVMETLAGEAARGRLVIIVLHDVAMALRFCSRAIAIADGRIAADGAPEQLLTSGALSTLYGVDFALAQTETGDSAAVMRRNPT